MLKNLSLIAICCFAFLNSASANKIDLLKTDKEVADFIVSLDSAHFNARYSPKLSIPTYNEIIAKSKLPANSDIKPWQKIDINNDGLTDLVVVAEWYKINSFIIIDDGNNKFKLLRLFYSPFNDAEVVKVINGKRTPLLFFYARKRFIFKNRKKFFTDVDSTVVDTLIYRFEHFIEYNPSPVSKKVVNISFSTNTCLGSCPKFSLNINNQGQADYVGDIYAKLEGKYHATISKSNLKILFDVIDYTDFEKIKDSYAVPWTDDTSAILSITFADGTTKTINDYGEVGTWGLRKIYSLFFNFYNTLHWDKN